MKKILTTIVLLFVLTCGALALGLVSGAGQAKAQPAGKYEFAYLLPVPRAELYNQELESWRADKAAKDFIKARVFTYENGDGSPHTERLNCLKLLDSLSQDGWEVVDARAGLLRRAK